MADKQSGKDLFGGSEPSKRRNVRPVIKDGFGYIERMWAEDGIIKVENKEGRVTTMTVKDAAFRAAQLNAMDVPNWHRKSRDDLVARVVACCREARHQAETPGNVRAVTMTNMLKGLTPDGKPLSTLDSGKTDAHKEAVKLSTTIFVHLGLDDIIPVLSEKSLGREAQMRILADEDNRRAMEKIMPGLQI